MTLEISFRALPSLRKRGIFTHSEFLSNGGSFMKKSRVICVSALAAALAIASAARMYSQGKPDKKDSGETHKIVHFGDLKWTPIIKGCDIASLSGDLNAEGQPFVLRFRCVDGAKTPPHWHPTDEYVTVLKGTFLVGMGESFDDSKLQTMNVGNFVVVPKEMRHFAMTKGETIIQVHGTGPFKVNWVNPSEVQPPDAAPDAKPKP
jgi:quercetin dioxygenase-like cupin family protein